MAVRSAKAEWKGNLRDGSGTVESETGAVTGSYSFGSRFEEDRGTNPEELIGAAHAGCFSMALAGALAKAGHEPESIRTTARVHLDKSEGGFSITRIRLETRGRVPGIDADTFREHAEGAKSGCPVSRALSAVPIEVETELEN